MDGIGNKITSIQLDKETLKLINLIDMYTRANTNLAGSIINLLMLIIVLLIIIAVGGFLLYYT